MKHSSGRLITLGLVFTVIYFTSIDIAFLLSLNIYGTLRYVLIFAGLFCIGLLLGRLSEKLLISLCFIPPFLVLVFVGCCHINRNFNDLKCFSENAAYRCTETGKQEIYSGKKVLFIVPHEDDEINLAGGIISQYTKYGSEVYCLFSTNGDFRLHTDARIREAIDSLRIQGVPEKNILFLGYGDKMTRDGKHFYNLPPDEVVVSSAEDSTVYASDTHPAFHPGSTYTPRHFREDLKNAVLSIRADTVYCSDYDDHVDHKALSLTFDSVMGEILKEYPQYRPNVFKGYTYSTAYTSEYDFYKKNIVSTIEPECLSASENANVFNWDDRIRLPVNTDEMSHSLLGCGQYRAIQAHVSQRNRMHGERIINGDKVFWERETSSLCGGAEIKASSGSPSVLNDFMLYDSTDIVTDADITKFGIWSPEKGDSSRCVTVKFSQPTDVFRVKLYDNPSLTDNVLDASLVFDDGFTLHTGALASNGSETEIKAERHSVTGFTLKLEETEGENAGLSEIEVYDRLRIAPFRYVKLTDEAGNFAYDRSLSLLEKCALTPVFFGFSPEDGSFEVSCEGRACKASEENGIINISCPIGRHCRVRIKCGGLEDEVYVSRPILDLRAVGQFVEKTLVNNRYREELSFIEQNVTARISLGWENLFAIRMAKRIAYLLGAC